MFITVPSILVFSFFAVLWCYSKWTNRHFNRLAAKLNGPPGYPIVGSMLKLFGPQIRLLGKIIKLSKDYGPEPFKMWFGPYFTVFISKPEDVQVILSSSKALKKPGFYKFLKGLGEGLLTAPVDKWKIHRRIITPAFNSKLLEQFFHVFNEKNNNLIRSLREELDKTVPFNLWDYVLPTTLDIICQTAMGCNLKTQFKGKSEFENSIIKVQESYAERITRPWLYPNIVNSMYEKLLGIHKLYEMMYKLPLQLITEKKQEFAKNIKDVDSQGEKNLKIFLDILLELDHAGANFSVDDLKDEVLTMMVAGSETTAITSCFCLLMLAIHQDIQDKVYDEIYSVLGDSDEPISMEDVNKLSYLEQVLLETLRLYPSGPLILRETEDDIKIFSGGHVLPKGTLVALFLYDVHRNSELYSDPSTFNPENFNRENIAKRHKYGFVAFSRGARSCIGSKYAMLSMKVLMCKILQNFSVHTDLKFSDIQLSLDILLRNTNGYPVTIRSRERRPTFKREKEDVSVDK